jgi:Subtilase family
MQGEQWQSQQETDRWELAIAADKDVARDTSPGRGFLYRPGRLLVHPDLVSGQRADWRHTFALLRRAGAEYAEDEAARTAEAIGLTLLRVDERAALPRLVRALREVAPAGAALDHVFVGDPQRFHGCDPALPADPPGPGDIPGQGSAGAGLTAAVLDTGVWSAWGLPLAAAPTDEDQLDGDLDHLLDAPAGHGTFVASVLLRHAPGAKVVARKVLHGPAGLASELDVARALFDLPEVDVINCSFGGPGQDDAAPLVIERALQQLSPKTVVVAAAGNQGDRRPHWPAASKRVIGVAAVQDGKETEGWALADYSSHGPWVDACAPGTKIHGAFVEFDETPADPTNGRTFKRGALWSGTSFAAPAVSAAILALAERDGIPVREAAYRLIDDPARPRIHDGGTLVLPDFLP